MAGDISGDVGGFYAADLAARAFGHIRGGRHQGKTAAFQLLDQIIAEVDAEFDRYGFCTFGYYGA